jgi:Fis family transcriptional regulator
MATGCNMAWLATGLQPDIHNKNYSITDMSKDSIQDVVKKSLEKYFKDLGEQQPSNVYEMVVFTVEKPILEAVMARAEGNQSHAAEMLGINRNTLRKKLQQHGLI